MFINIEVENPELILRNFGPAVRNELIKSICEKISTTIPHETRLYHISQFPNKADNIHELVRKAAFASYLANCAVQPVICLDTGKCISVEGLIRWKDPELGNVPPNHFLPYLEQSALA